MCSCYILWGDALPQDELEAFSKNLNFYEGIHTHLYFIMEGA